jgi:DNA polymerase III subunit alpha
MSADSHPAGTHERIAQAFNECVRLGITVLPPDVNRSAANFRLEDLPDGGVAIRFGLGMIKNVGEGAAESLIASRQAAGGSFDSLDGFCREINTRNLNKRALESLVKAGCLDSVAGTPDARGAILVNLDRILSIAQSAQRLKETGQATMFDLFGAEVATPLAGLDLESVPVPRGELLAWEKELLGIWISEHPFTRAATQLVPHVTALCNEITPELLADLPSQGRDFVIAGLVGSTRRLTTRDGRGFIAAEVQDLSGAIEVTVWPDIYERTAELWKAGQILLIQVRVRERGDRLTAGVQEVAAFNETFTPPLWLTTGQLSNQAFGQNNHIGRAAGPAAPEGRVVDTDSRRTGPAAQSPRPSGEKVRERGEPPSGPSAFQLTDSGELEVSEDELLVEEVPLDELPDPLPEKPAVFTPSALRLVLQETSDEAADQRRLSSVFRLLQEHPGPDPIHLTIHTRAGDEIDLSLPTARVDDELRGHLLAAVAGILAQPPV